MYAIRSYYGGLPGGGELHLGHAVVQKIHVQAADLHVAPGGVEIAGVGELAEHRGLHVHLFRQAQELGELVLRHGQGHALLGLGKRNNFV